MSHLILQTEAERAADYKRLKVTSPAFDQEGRIPVKYTCDGANISPPLHLEHIPLNAQSLVLIVTEDDAPAGTGTLWIVWNIPVTHQIKENEIHGMEGTNDRGQNRYAGPCPPSGTHRYYFKVYAMDRVLELAAQTRREVLETAISGYIIAFGELVGIYDRKQQ